jgi:hypothetical protein
MWSMLAAALTIAQWFNFPSPGIPRLPDGKPDLAAPAPKTHEGKPDLSGIWRSDPVEDGFTYARNIAADLRPEEVQPWAASIALQRGDTAQRDAPWARCLPVGIPLNETSSAPYRIVQTSGLIFIFHEEFDTAPRQIFTDGRELPKDPNPTWMGYSVGEWDGDTLVVETTGFNDKTWLDQMGHPHSEALRITERFRRLDLGRMTLQITVDDPKAFTAPITLKRHPRLLADYDMLEFFCDENERDSRHMH